MSDRRLHRRTVLRGAGVALALPWLESLAPRLARGQTVTPPRTFVAMSFPSGAADFWKPAAPGSGDAWTLSPILTPLAPVKSHVNVLANVGNYGPFGGHIEPSNSNLGGALLTCTKPKAIDAYNVTTGISVDQVIAQSVTGRTKIDSLQVGLCTIDQYTDGLPGACSRSISWSAPDNPLYKTIDPASVFDRIVGAVKPVGAGPLAFARASKNKSVLDFVAAHASSVQSQVSRSDAARLDSFLTSVRALEQKIATTPSSPAACVAPPRPTGTLTVGNVPADYNRDAHANIMIDLVVMALQCDATRVVSFMLDDVRSTFPYTFLMARDFTATGSTPTSRIVSGGPYSLNAAGETNSDYATVNFWFVEKLSRLAQKLMATPTATGNMLDDATIWLGSEMHGPNHDGLDLPMVVVGKGGGTLQTNRYIDYAQTTRKTERLANLYLTFIKNVFRIPMTSFGGNVTPTQPLAAPANAYGPGTTTLPEILA
ncbi:MAG TPA: DUF1552 domain-containing protein [Polyangia bacterium]|nr:DUF1552 domain-containing protein [Polyangia bacterium]